MKRAWFSLLLVVSPATALAGLLTGQGAYVLDQTGVQRATFSNNERVVLQQKVFNSVASANRLNFRFFILSPTNVQVFQHLGNAVVGSIGNAASQVSGVPVSQFYTGPGFYTFRAEAELDGQIISQQATFSVSSPNILLIYPPNGARNMADNPLTFRWNASGASRYRVTVGDNPSLYNSIFNQSTSGSESFLSYPQNPTDPRQRLTAGQVYYWSVEGLDPAGNVIAKSETPFNYSVSATALAKDLAVTDLTIESVGLDGSVKMKVRVLNQGNTTENSINLRVGVGGLPAVGTPISVSGLNPGEAREWTVDGAIPVDQKQTLATACLELFDDNVPNNCKTLSVARPEAGSGATQTAGSGGAALLSPDQMLEMLTELLRSSGVDLSGYDLDASMDPNTMAALIDGLRQGTVSATITGTPGVPDRPPAVVGSTVGEERAKVMPDFGNAPETPSDAGGEQVTMSLEQAWGGLSEQLGRSGLSLGGFEPSGEVDPNLLAEFLDGLRKGTVTASLTGAPVPPPVTPGPKPDSKAPVMPDFGLGGEPPPAAEEEKPEEPKRSPAENWTDLTQQVQKLGIDLGGYELSGKVDQETLVAMLDGLKKGTVKAEITGAPPAAPAGGEPPIRLDAAGPEPAPEPATPLDNLLNDKAPETPKADEAGDEGGAEWNGMAGPAGKTPYTFVVKDQEDWVRRWKRLREGKVPVVDFSRSVVVGVVAGALDGAERVEIEGVGMGGSGLVVRYRLMQRSAVAADKPRTRVPWILRQVKASPGLEVRFERAVEDGGER